MSDGSPWQQPGAQVPAPPQAPTQPFTPPSSPPVPGAPAAHPGSVPAPTPTAPSTGSKLAGAAWLSLAAAAGLAVAVWVEEDNSSGWDRYGVWGIFAIVAALATAAPLLRDALKLGAERAWQVAAGGAVGLAAFWVLLILPSIEANLSFVATIACAAGVLAAWLAPGRPAPPDRTDERW